MLVVYICAALKISTGTPASRGPSATAGLLVKNNAADAGKIDIEKNIVVYAACTSRRWPKVSVVQDN